MPTNFKFNLYEINLPILYDFHKYKFLFASFILIALIVLIFYLWKTANNTDYINVLNSENNNNNNNRNRKNNNRRNNNRGNNNRGNNNRGNNNRGNNNIPITGPLHSASEREQAYDVMRRDTTVSETNADIVREDLKFRACLNTEDGSLAKLILERVNGVRPSHIQKSVLGGQIRQYQLHPKESIYIDLGFISNDNWEQIPNSIISDSRNIV